MRKTKDNIVPYVGLTVYQYDEDQRVLLTKTIDRLDAFSLGFIENWYADKTKAIISGKKYHENEQMLYAKMASLHEIFASNIASTLNE